MSDGRGQLKLKPLEIPYLPAYLDVPSSGLAVGRDGENHIILDPDRYPYTSARHARFARDGELLIVEDLDSKNGTLVNGQDVKKRVLRPGDVVQLGRELGARFLVVQSGAASDTLEVRQSPRTKTAASIGPSTIVRLRRALGLPESGGIEAGTNGRGKRRGSPAFVATIALLALLAVLGFFYIRRIQREVERSREDFAASQARGLEEFRAMNAELAQRLAQTSATMERREREREEQRDSIARDKDALAAKLATLEEGGRTSAGEIRSLQEALAATSAKLEQFDPLRLEEIEISKRKQLEKVLASIVLIEKKIAFREQGGERFLHSVKSKGERLRLAGADSDLHYDALSTGSGFCVSPDGWIVTNGHVVEPPEIDTPLRFGGVILEMVPIIDVVFSGTSAKRRATIVQVVQKGDDDFALLKIEPFPDMPLIEGFSTDVRPPLPGSAVRLFGFPLGRVLLQEGDTYTASIFAGIVSRRVEAYIQVQAAVYPGNSGGPVVDEEGRVFGIVTAVQTVPGGQIAADIGFVIPIARLSSIWPPPAK